jgi:hypothetical protein
MTDISSKNPTLQTAGSRDKIKTFGCASGLVPEVHLKSPKWPFRAFPISENTLALICVSFTGKSNHDGKPPGYSCFKKKPAAGMPGRFNLFGFRGGVWRLDMRG